MHMLIQDSYQMQIQKFPDLSSIKGCKKKTKAKYRNRNKTILEICLWINMNILRCFFLCDMRRFYQKQNGKTTCVIWVGIE